MPFSSRKLACFIAIVLAIGTGVSFAAPDFYANQLRRGIAEFNAGRHASAATLLRTAAFGLLDTVDQFETAQAYLAVAAQRLGRDDDARQATRRIVAAERVQRRFASLPLPADLRAEFVDVARRYLTVAEHTALTDTQAAVPPREAQPPVARRASPSPAPAPARPEKDPPAEKRAEQPIAKPPAAQAAAALPTPPTEPRPASANNPAEQSSEAQPPASKPNPLRAGAEPPLAEPKSMERPAEKPAPTVPAATQVSQPQPISPPPPPLAANPQPVPATSASAGRSPQAAPAPPESHATLPKQTPSAAVPQEPVVRSEPPVTPQPPPAQPSPEAVREAQREFERRVVEAEQAAATRPSRAVPARDVARTLDEAARAIDRNDLAAARTALRSVLDARDVRRADLLRTAEESYRSREFRLTLEAFERAGRLKSGEEPLGYYRAVALYETGRYAEAKEALRAALPFIEMTPDVTRYYAKIEGAVH